MNKNEIGDKEKLRDVAIELSKAIKDRRIKAKIDSIITKNFDEIITLSRTLPQMGKEVREEDLKLAYDLFEVSKEDLKTCKILYIQNIFNFAVYHIQQSIEKLAKAYGLTLGYISRDDLRKCSHTTPRVFIQMLQDNFIGRLMSIFNQFGVDASNVSEVRKLFFEKKSKESLIELEKEVAFFDKRKIMMWIDTGKNIREKLKKKQREIDETLEKLEKIAKNMSQITQDEKDQIISVCQSVRNRFKVDFISNFIMLYILSVITFPHFSSTRYPDGKIKPSHYKPGLGVVDCLDEIIKEVEHCIKFYTSLLAP